MSTKTTVKTTECSACNTKKDTKTEFRRGQKVCKECENDPNVMFTKVCNTCKEEKDSSLFQHNRAKCKECVSNVNRESLKLQKCVGCEEEKEKSEFRRSQVVCKICESDPNVEFVKNCNECNTIKPGNCFRKNRRKCIDCEQEYGRNYGKTTDTRKKWVEENRERMSELQHKAYENRKEEIREKESRRYHDDPHTREVKRYRAYLVRIVQGQNKTCDSLCATREVFMHWLSYQFSDEMTQDNYGIIWELDHVLPLNSLKTKQVGNATLDGNLAFIYAWYNIRPIMHDDNIKKSMCMPSKDTIDEHLEKLLKFIEIYKGIYKIKLGTTFFVYKRSLKHVANNM